MESETPVALASPPRPITAKVRRRAWMESGVRLWWMCALASALAAAVVLLTESLSWVQQKRMFDQSVVVDAQAYEPNGFQLQGRNLLIEGRVFEVRYTYNGTPYSVEGPLDGMPGYMTSGSVFKIRIDPRDPERWSARIGPPLFALRWIGPGLTVLPAIPLLLVARIKYGRVVELYRDGELRMATVVASNSTPTAPRSYSVRCALLDSDDRRVLSVLLPSRFGKLAKGDELDVIVDPADIQRIIPAAPFVI